MLLLTAVSSLLTGFLVAVGVIGRETSRLGRQRREPVWRLEEAAMFVAENLPYNAASELDPLELKELLRWHLNQLQFSESESESVSSLTQFIGTKSCIGLSCYYVFDFLWR